MSKTQQAKTAQGYIEKPVHPMCSNCVYIRHKANVRKNGSYGKPSITCALGKFATKDYSACSKYEFNNQVKG